MEKLDNTTLSLLSILIIPGVLLMPYFWDNHLILISIAMCAIGGLAFGTLVGRKM